MMRLFALLNIGMLVAGVLALYFTYYFALCWQLKINSSLDSVMLFFLFEGKYYFKDIAKYRLHLMNLCSLLFCIFCARIFLYPSLVMFASSCFPSNLTIKNLILFDLRIIKVLWSKFWTDGNFDFALDMGKDFKLWPRIVWY